jgi:UDP-GlcNAc:undecaprenyl-phosphate GlcNAc-1-phosphate transferase
MLAVLPLMDRGQGKDDISLFLGATIALVPIFDTFAAIWRRKKEASPSMAPDQWHIHHKLLRWA